MNEIQCTKILRIMMNDIFINIIFFNEQTNKGIFFHSQ